MSDKKVITRDNWLSSFSITGKIKLNNYSFKIDEHSEKSKWVYNSMNIGIEAGEKNGTIYTNMMGGYSEERNNIIYAHGKNEDGTDNFKSQIQVDWEDRFDDEILENIGDFCFINVGIEKTDKDKIFVKKFLSAYDAIKYIYEHIENEMVINVRGNLKYSIYNDKTQVQKNITSIMISNAEKKNYQAKFTQTILINSDSASLKDIDKDKGVMYVNTRVLDYIKELNGVEIKGQYPFAKQFEFEMDFTKPDICKKIMDKVFKVRKGVTQITFEGEFVEGNASSQTTIDDIPQEIKDLIDCGIYTEEEALARCAANGSKEQRMILRKPMIRLVGEEKSAEVQRFEEKYTEDDLYLDYLYKANEEAEALGEGVDDSNTESTSTDGDLSWLENL